MKRTKPEEQKDQPILLELPKAGEPDIKVGNLKYPIWTENKAKLIERYLYYFVLITKHGTYIDGFAGPQEPDKPEMWAAKLVLESEPKRIRHFHLFEIDKKKIEMLTQLKNSQPPRNKERREPKRDIHIYEGDFNTRIMDLLKTNIIREKEATFCLLDQRTTQCHWSTVRDLAEYKKSDRKIELFYFFMNAWLGRTFANEQDKGVLDRWWGRKDWVELRKLRSQKRAELFADRFKNELGYRSVMSWPIYEHPGGGRIMYYMIHATDHPEAPKLMYRAYHRAVLPKESFEQLSLEMPTMV
jgi:three-Cys-motif partner protein